LQKGYCALSSNRRILGPHPAAQLIEAIRNIIAGVNTFTQGNV
jgi:hypothetical protein